MDHSTLNWMDDFSYDELEFKHVAGFAVEYESFLMNDEPRYDVFDFHDACSVDFIVEVAFACNTSTVPLDLYLTP